MKNIAFHFRNPINIVITVVTMILFCAITYYLFFDVNGFSSLFDYLLGWFSLVVLVLLPNFLIIKESVKEYRQSKLD